MLEINVFVLYCIIWCRPAVAYLVPTLFLSCIVLYRIVSCRPTCRMPRSLSCLVLYCMVLYHIVLYCIVLCRIVSYCIVSYCIVLYHVRPAVAHLLPALHAGAAPQPAPHAPPAPLWAPPVRPLPEGRRALARRGSPLLEDRVHQDHRRGQGEHRTPGGGGSYSGRGHRPAGWEVRSRSFRNRTPGYSSRLFGNRTLGSGCTKL